MDGPLGRKHRLVAAHPDVTRLVHLSHEVADSLVVGHLEVEVRLHTAAVHMCRHGVPHAARGELGHTHLQLAGRQHLIDEHLVNVALVAHLQTAHVRYNGISLGDQFVGIRAMRCGGVEIEQCRFVGIYALKAYLAVTTTEVEGLLEVQFICLVACNHAALAAYVEDTHLAAGEEERCFQRVDGLQQQTLAHGQCSTNHHAVVHRIDHIHLVGRKHALDKEIFAQTRRIIALSVNGIRRIAYFVVCLHIIFNYFIVYRLDI